MAYNDTPLPTDLISDSQPDIRENFQLLEDSQVVDEGSTADGDYIRYENGWQICTSIETIDNLEGNRLNTSWNFPATFESKPCFLHTPNISMLTVSIRPKGNPGYRNLSNDSVEVVFEGDGDGSDYLEGESVDTQCLAMGRWK